MTVCDATAATPADLRRATIASSTASRPPGSIFMRLMTKILVSGPAVYLGSFQVLCTSVLSERPPGLHVRVLPQPASTAAATTRTSARIIATILPDRDVLAGGGHRGAQHVRVADVIGEQQDQ